MAAEIDPVILELRAEMGRFRAELKNSTDQTSRNFARMERDTQRLEKQMLKSSTAIAGSFRTLGTTLSSYFTGRELVGLLDNFTRLQNSLRVAGLEGADLARVQGELLNMSARYGVSVNELADLFGKATQAGSDLGASQQQLLQITEASAQALKITGTSAVQAQGALLGLTQALASGTVRAEEFNQINEGGLRPLLQLAANADRFGGSVAKLRQAVVDGKFSSEEFFSAILKGSDELEGKASKATLTLAGAFSALTSALTVYVGQSAEANGVTAALTGAMQLLADNLDTIIPALAIIATALAGRFVAGAIAGGTALRTLAAYASIATTSLAGTALAARGAGAALLAAFGGPVGAAITAITLALVGVSYATRDTAAGLEELEANLATAESRLDDARKQAKDAGINIDKLGSATDSATSSFSTFTNAVWAGVDAMTSAAKAAKDLTLAKIALSSAEARSTIAELSPLARKRASGIRFSQDAPGFSGGGPSAKEVSDLNEISARLDVAAATLRANAETTRIIQALGPAFKESGSARSAATAGGGDKKKKGRSGRSGPTESEIEDRFNQELASIAQQTLSARQQMATSAAERSELELRGVELARVAALESVEADKRYSAAQKARVADAIENLAEIERERIARDQRLQEFDEGQSLAEERNRAEADALKNQFDLARTDEDRRRIALQILEAEDAYLRSKLGAVIANQDLEKAVRDQAKIALDALNSSAGDRRKLVEKANQGALGRYIEDIGDTKARAEEAVVRELQAVNDGITDALSSALGVKNQFVKDLFSIFLDQVIFQPLAQALQDGGSGGGIGGFFSSIIGSIFGRASGGYNAPHSLTRVNEHAGGVELLRMGSQGGTVIPLGQVNTRAASSAPASAGTVKLVIEEAPGFAARVRTEAQGVAIDVQRQAAPALINASANEAMKRTAKAQRYGS